MRRSPPVVCVHLPFSWTPTVWSARRRRQRRSMNLDRRRPDAVGRDVYATCKQIHRRSPHQPYYYTVAYNSAWYRPKATHCRRDPCVLLTATDTPLRRRVASTRYCEVHCWRRTQPCEPSNRPAASVGCVFPQSPLTGHCRATRMQLYSG